MSDLTKVATAFMLINKHGDVVMAEPGKCRREAWGNVRRKYGAFATLQFKKRGYRPEQVSIMVNMRSEWRW